MKVRFDNLKINEQQNNLHINVLPTTKFKTTTITLKFMAPLDSETMTARSILSKLLVRATKNGQQTRRLTVIFQNCMARMLIALSQNLKTNMSSQYHWN